MGLDFLILRIMYIMLNMIRIQYKIHKLCHAHYYPLWVWPGTPGINKNKPKEDGVIDGARTHDNRNHNPGLYQLSYDHH